MSDQTKQGQVMDPDIPADVLAALHERPYIRPFELGVMKPDDAAYHFERLTNMYWGISHMMICAAEKYTASGRSTDGSEWFDEAFPGDCLIGVSDEFRGVPFPAAIMLGMLERLHKFSEDFVRCVRHHHTLDCRDPERAANLMEWVFIRPLVGYGLLSEGDANTFREVVAKIIPAWAALQAREGEV